MYDQEWSFLIQSFHPKPLEAIYYWNWEKRNKTKYLTWNSIRVKLLKITSMLDPANTLDISSATAQVAPDQFKAIKVSINVSNVPWRVAHVFGMVKKKSIQNIYVTFTKLFLSGLLNLGAQIRCTWNQYTTVQMDLKYLQQI